MMPELIGLIGAKGAGKSSVAQYLIYQQGYTRLSFADPLKHMLKTIGCTDEQLWGEDKEKPNPIFGGATTRHAMQTLGTEWGRDLVWSEIWVQAWYRAAEEIRYVVTDDLRYENELAAFRNLQGYLIRIDRPGYEGDAHSSEQGWKTMKPDAIISNTGSLADLHQAVDHLISRVGIR